MGLTDSGERTLYYLILIKIDLKQKKNKAVLLINNGIHPGEPDGIDATNAVISGFSFSQN
jgi:hypothetical protein